MSEIVQIPAHVMAELRQAEIDALREQIRVLREALDTIACGTEDKIPPYRCIDFAMAKRIAQAVLTATSQPHTQHDIAQAEANGFL